MTLGSLEMGLSRSSAALWNAQSMGVPLGTLFSPVQWKPGVHFGRLPALGLHAAPNPPGRMKTLEGTHYS